MNSILPFVLFFVIMAFCNGNRIMKNFVVLLDGIGYTNTDENILSNVIASPILKTTPRIIPESEVIINYSVKFPYFDEPVPIPLSKNYTLDYFSDFIRKNIRNVNASPLKQLNFLIEETPPFTDILMITKTEPETPSDSLPEILDSMNRKRINVIVSTFDYLLNFFETNLNLYDSIQLTNINDEYRRINKQTKVMKSEMFFTKILKQMLIKDDNEPTRNSTITVINGMAFYDHLQIWDFAIRVGVFLSEFNQTQLFKYNGQVMWINDFSVMYSFENDYIVKINLTAEYIPGTYIDVLIDHCKNANIRKMIKFAMKKHMKHHPDDMRIYNELWLKESAKIKFPLTSLLTALIDSFPKSVVYVLTDVPAENTELIPFILNIMKEKDITVVITYFGEEKSDPEEYIEINKASIIAL